MNGPSGIVFVACLVRNLDIPFVKYLNVKFVVFLVYVIPKKTIVSFYDIFDILTEKLVVSWKVRW